MQPKCQHEHTIVVTLGGMHFAGGEVYDNFHDQIVCEDCGAQWDAEDELPIASSDQDCEEIPC